MIGMILGKIADRTQACASEIARLIGEGVSVRKTAGNRKTRERRQERSVSEFKSNRLS